MSLGCVPKGPNDINSLRPSDAYMMSEIWFKIEKFIFKEMHLKIWSAKVTSILPSLNVLR